MKKSIGLIGVPSSAGAHWPGQEKTPQHLRNAGLVDRLNAEGIQLVDYGDLPMVRFRPDIEHRHQQNLAAVVEVARTVADRVDRALQDNTIPLVIGGDCTIGLGVMSGFLRHSDDLGLLYMDGHVDLNTPATTSSGILDSMGTAHMIGECDAAYELSHVGSRFPLLPEERIVLFGYNPREMNACERDLLTRRQFVQFPLSAIQGIAVQAATAARECLEALAKEFVLHLDVDVIDFTDLPVSNVPQLSRGLMFGEVIECISILVCSPNFAGLTVTEFNPNHVMENPAVCARFIDGLTQALTGREPARPRATVVSP